MARFHFANLMAVVLAVGALSGVGMGGEQSTADRTASPVVQDSAADKDLPALNQPAQSSPTDEADANPRAEKPVTSSDAKPASSAKSRAASTSGIPKQVANPAPPDTSDRAARREKSEIQQLLRSKRPENRSDALRRLPEINDPEMAKLLIDRALRDPADEVRRAGFDVLMQCKDNPEICDHLLKAAAKNARGTHNATMNVPVLAVLLSSDLPDIEHDTLALMDKLAVGPNGVVVITTLADELGNHGHAIDAQVLRKLGKLSAFEKSFAVRRAVVHALIHIPEKDAIDALVRLLDKLDGEAEADAVNYLNVVTKRMFGAGNSAAWMKWWAENKESYKYVRPTSMAYEPLLDQGSYYGLPLNGKRLVFIIDISGSMAGPRIAAAERELLHAIMQLRGDVYFNIIVFNSYVDAWQKQLVAATSHNKEAASQFIGKLVANRMTASYDALETAFNYDAEAIYFLTDGDPTAGKIVDSAKIVEAITALNRQRRMTIHTIGIGAGMPDGPSDSFLRVLAENNYGIYRRVDQ